MPDLLDLTARQVRRDHKDSTVHRLTGTVQRTDRRVYQTRCGELLSNAAGGLLTTRDVDCPDCKNAGVRRV